MPYESLIGSKNTPDEESSFEATKPLTHEDTRASFESKAVAKIFNWLFVFSPNNPSHHTSDIYLMRREWLHKHAPSLRESIKNGVSSLSDKNEAVDLYHIDLIKNGTALHRNGYTNNIEPEAREFTIQDFMEAGISEVLRESYSNTPEDDVDEINANAVRAIGAMVVRGAYFDSLHQKHPDVLTEELNDHFEKIFRQNILSIVQKASWLAQVAHSRPATELSHALPSDEQMKVAV